jgi:putative membrane protein
MKQAFVYGTVVLALATAPVLAQQPAGSGSSQPAKAPSQAQPTKAVNPDHGFVVDAAMGGMAEVEIGELASDKAQSDEVKKFAQRMVTDHGKVNDELKTLAQNKNIALPTDSGAKHKATKDRLAKLSGAAFDKAYMQEMLTDHRKDVGEFQKQSRTAKDPDVKVWATKTLPMLEEHLQLAQTASRSAVGTSGTKSGSESEKGASGGSTSSPGGPTGSSSPR